MTGIISQIYSYFDGIIEASISEEVLISDEDRKISKYTKEKGLQVAALATISGIFTLVCIGSYLYSGPIVAPLFFAALVGTLAYDLTRMSFSFYYMSATDRTSLYKAPRVRVLQKNRTEVINKVCQKAILFPWVIKMLDTFRKD